MAAPKEEGGEEQSLAANQSGQTSQKAPRCPAAQALAIRNATREMELAGVLEAGRARVARAPGPCPRATARTSRTWWRRSC